MVNRWRGDVALVVNGQRRVARLTLGALAELEDALEEPSLVALVERFEGHRFSSRDVLLLLAAGLRAGGTEVSAETLAQAEIEGGPVAVDANHWTGSLWDLANGATAPGISQRHPSTKMALAGLARCKVLPGVRVQYSHT